MTKNSVISSAKGDDERESASQLGHCLGLREIIYSVVEGKSICDMVARICHGKLTDMATRELVLLPTNHGITFCFL